MEPKELGTKYDRIAGWWQKMHHDSQYGMKQLETGLRFVTACGAALDVGCGAGGRMIRRLLEDRFKVTGIDVSEEMIRLASRNHPEGSFLVRDITTWETDERFDFIVAWDSIFHLPLHMHRPVIDKLCNLLNQDGVLMYTFGNAVGEHIDTWHDDEFYYSSIGINGNLAALMDNGLTIMHLELDQFPERHVFVVGRKS